MYLSANVNMTPSHRNTYVVTTVAVLIRKTLILSLSYLSHTASQREPLSHYCELWLYFCMYIAVLHSYASVCVRVSMFIYSTAEVYITFCICVCARASTRGWGPQGPLLMSYLCVFLTRTRYGAHSTVIGGRG